MNIVFYSEKIWGVNSNGITSLEMFLKVTKVQILLVYFINICKMNGGHCRLHKTLVYGNELGEMLA